MPRQEPWNIFSLSTEGTNPAGTLISEFQPPDLGASRCLMAKAPLCEVLCGSSSDTVIRSAFDVDSQTRGAWNRDLVCCPARPGLPKDRDQALPIQAPRVCVYGVKAEGAGTS